MNSGSPSTSSCDQGWRDLYIAALFENDKSKIANKIVQAQTAVVPQRRKLLAFDNDVQQRQVLDNALFSLQALGNCLSIPILGDVEGVNNSLQRTRK
jgi:hypothetical protein